MDKKELLNKLKEKNVGCEDLDDTTHDAASILASEANNGGLEAQVDFLMDKCGWSAEDIIKEV